MVFGHTESAGTPHSDLIHTPVLMYECGPHENSFGILIKRRPPIVRQQQRGGDVFGARRRVGVPELNGFFPVKARHLSVIFVTKSKTSPPRQLSRAEQETETAAERLKVQIEAALAAVAVQTQDGVEELEACADRLERAARDLSVALRELAEQRSASSKP